MDLFLSFRCNESRTASVCTNGNVRWKVTPDAGDFAVRAVELKIRNLPGAEVLLPATAPLTVTLEGQRVGSPAGGNGRFLHDAPPERAPLRRVTPASN
jgi:hypothetical protein